MDVVLVWMPYAEIRIPSLALGLLQAVLEREGLTAQSVYANVMLADRIGMADYGQFIARTRPQEAFGDWTFAHIAFPDYEPDHEEYTKLIRSRSWFFRREPYSEFVERMFSVREETDRLMDRLVARILDTSPTIVGCSSTFSQHVPSLALLRRIRKAAPQIVTMLGGANCETIMGRVNHESFTWVDYVVSGEADNLIGPLVRGIIEKGRDMDAGDLPEGVFAPVHRRIGYPTSDNGHADNCPRATVPTLENQPPPNYDDYFRELNDSVNIRNSVTPGLTVETSRGCWWGHRKGCTFCGLNGRGKRFRAKSADQAIEELSVLSNRYGVSRVEAVDNIMDMGFFKTLLPRLKAAGSPFRLFYETKSNLGRRHIQQMREAGITWIQPGIESLHTKVLSLMNKGCKAWHNVQLLKWCRQFGIRVVWTLLYDFPGEEDSWYREMARMAPLLTHFQPPAGLSPIRFDRYSHYYENSSTYGLELVPARPYSYVYPLDEADLENLVYFFDETGRQAVETSEVLKILFVRPEVEELRSERTKWENVFRSNNRPVLSMNVTDDAVYVRDTRPIATASEHVLTSVERELYLACEGAPKAERVLEDIFRTGVSGAEVDAALASLVESKLLLELDNRLIALAVREPVPDVPELEDFPGGFVDYSCSRKPPLDEAPIRVSNTAT